jgi:hypothetical protein
MKIKSIRLHIMIFVLLTLFVSLVLPAGHPHYRIRERIEAMEAYTLNPSTSTKATLDNEFARLHHHEKMTGVILVPSFLLIDAALIYFFWNYGTRKLASTAH